jgi:hypothetical protein
MRKPLYIFDFDDTLALSDAKVIVTHKDGSIEELSSGHYATYKPLMGDKFNYEQFHGYPPNARLITNTFAKLEEALAKYSVDDVVVLTAREYCEPIIKFLKDHGVSKIPTMECTAGADPNIKGNYVAQRLSKGNYTDVYVFEDSHDNLIAIENAINKFPNVVYHPTHVQVQESGILRTYVRAILLEMRKNK